MEAIQMKISVVLNTLNEEKNIRRAIGSIGWADEIIVCDMYSDDKTVEIARKLGAKVVFYKRTGYVEPARNFAISKAVNDLVLILDADEEIPQVLADKLIEISSRGNDFDFIEIPRKNIIFGKWMKASMWWPDYNVRFFRKGKVLWSNEIHRPPETSGIGLKLDPEEKYAIIHHNYENISQYLERMDRYSKIQAEEFKNKETKFGWSSLISQPVSEFLRRFFANKGYEDGKHGLVLSLLQAFSFLLVYIRLWEMEGFKEGDVNLNDLEHVSKEAGKGIKYWFHFSVLSKNPIRRIFQKTKNKFT